MCESFSVMSSSAGLDTALLDLIFIKKKGLVRDVKAGGSLGYRTMKWWGSGS